MSPLAEAVYALLRRRASRPDPRITYGELARQLRDTSDDFDHVYPRSRELVAVLCEVGDECRRLGLPCLAALVVRADTRRPGDAYYQRTRPGVSFKGELIAAWREEVDAVKRAAYPVRRPVRGQRRRSGR